MRINRAHLLLTLAYFFSLTLIFCLSDGDGVFLSNFLDFKDSEKSPDQLLSDSHSARKRGYENVPYPNGRYAILPQISRGYGPYDITNDRKKAGQNLFPQQRIGNGYGYAQQQQQFPSNGYGQPPDSGVFGGNPDDSPYFQQSQSDFDPSGAQPQVPPVRTGSLEQFVTYSGNSGDKAVSGETLVLS